MYSKLEEDYGLAKRSMAIYDRATQVVADEEKFEVGLPNCIAKFTRPNASLLRCSQFILQKRRQTTASQQLDPSMNAL